MAAFVGTLAVNVVANTGRFRTGMRTASRDVTKFTGTVNKSMRALTPFSSMFGAGIGFGAAYGLIRMGKAANDFSGAMTRSLAIMSDVGPKMRAEMERTAHSVAFNTQFSAREAAQAYFYLASAGMDAKESLAALPAVSRFAQAANMDLATATDLLTDAQSAMGMKSKDNVQNLKNMIRMSDALVKANTIANASVQQFSEAIGSGAGAASRMYGISLKETLAVLAVFADQSIKGADAATKYSIALRDLTTKAITNKKAFEDLGLRVFEFGEFRGWANIIKDLEISMAGKGGEERKTILLEAGFPAKSVKSLQMLLGSSGAIREYEERMDAMGGITKKVSDESLTDFDKMWNRVTGTMGKASAEGFTPILDQLATMAGRMDTLNSKLSENKSKWTKAGEAMATFMQVWDVSYRAFTIPRRVLFDLSVNRISTAYRAIKAGITGETWEAKSLSSQISGWSKDLAEEFISVPKSGDAADKLTPVARGRRARAEALAGGDRMRQAFSGEMRAQQEARKGAEKEREKWFEWEEKRWQKYQGILAGRDRADLLREQGERQKEYNRILSETTRIYERNRTPLEAYRDGLEDLNKLMEVGALKGMPGIVAREVGRLKADLEGALPQRGPTPGRAPALLRGTVEAWESLQRNLLAGEIHGPEERMADAVEKIEAKFPRLMQDLGKIVQKLVKPPVVETAL